MLLPTGFDRLIQEELLEGVRSGVLPPDVSDAVRAVQRLGAGMHAVLAGGPTLPPGTQAIYNSFTRPSMLVRNGAFEQCPSATWNSTLEQHRAVLESAIAGVGQIEIAGHLSLSIVGTGFLVGDNVVVTNRHVAVLFSQQQGDGFTWAVHSGAEVRAQIDFCREYQVAETRRFDVLDIIDVEDDTGPDLSLLRLEAMSCDVTPLRLKTSTNQNDAVAAIGYPSSVTPSSPEEEDAIERVFNNIFNVKRLAPGVVKTAGSDSVDHDCSTLNGSSGSPVVDVETGQVVAVHARPALRSNRAVPAIELERALERYA
ncbi:MAG: trypsin-like peptidase domain-containing protein [bacterium]|nr:trypsin-like peptidase domain-containing protein [bacterium]